MRNRLLLIAYLLGTPIAAELLDLIPLIAIQRLAVLVFRLHSLPCCVGEGLRNVLAAPLFFAINSLLHLLRSFSMNCLRESHFLSAPLMFTRQSP